MKLNVHFKQTFIYLPTFGDKLGNLNDLIQISIGKKYDFKIFSNEI